MLNYIWLIPVFPLLGAAIQLFLGRRLSNKAVSAVSVGLPGLSFVWAVGCFIQFLGFRRRTITFSSSLIHVVARRGVPSCRTVFGKPQRQRGNAT